MAVVGALSGAAKQVASAIAMIAAYFCARPAGAFVAPFISRVAGLSRPLSGIVSIALGSVVIAVAGRFALTAVLRKLMEAEPGDRGMDRTLGFVLGGAKAAFACYLVLSGLTFVEEHLKIAGKKVTLVSSKTAHSLAIVRRYNFFELTQLGAVKDLAAMAEASGDPAQLKKLQTNPEFLALRKDPRFKKVLSDPHLRAAAEKGDYTALLQNNAVLELIQDPESVNKLRAAMRVAD